MFLMANDESGIGQFGEKLTALLPMDDASILEADGMTTKGAIKVRLECAGREAQILGVRPSDLK